MKHLGDPTPAWGDSAGVHRGTAEVRGPAKDIPDVVLDIPDVARDVHGGVRDVSRVVQDTLSVVRDVLDAVRKKGKTDGVNVYARAAGEANWTFLGRDTHSPYLGRRPLVRPGTPEVREYQVRAVHRDEEIGVAS